MLNAGACGDALDLSAFDGAMAAERVVVFEFAGDDVGDDFHVAVGVHGEATCGRDDIFVDDAERTEAHVLWIAVVGEAEGVVGVEPAVIEVASVFAASDFDHGVAPQRVVLLFFVMLADCIIRWLFGWRAEVECT